MATWFSDEEVKGLDPALVSLLDYARERAGVQFKITSGLRTPEQNAAIGGAPNSAHLRGLAVDLACADSYMRYHMVRALLKVGFARLEVSPRHLHVDIADDLPQPILWLGPDK
jgi:zinc D-Ala-D-Ala carboxypeptidase